MARTKTVVEETGWEVFGKVVAFMLGVAGIILFIYVVFQLPYDRHKEIINKLDMIQYQRSWTK